MPERLPGLPRPRTLIHPGPVGAVRIEHRRAERGRHFRLSLPQGRSLYDALVEALASVRVQNASMTLLDGDLDALSFCLALPDDTGRVVATYGKPHVVERCTLHLRQRHAGQVERRHAGRPLPRRLPPAGWKRPRRPRAD